MVTMWKRAASSPPEPTADSQKFSGAIASLPFFIIRLRKKSKSMPFHNSEPPAGFDPNAGKYKKVFGTQTKIDGTVQQLLKHVMVLRQGMNLDKVLPDQREAGLWMLRQLVKPHINDWCTRQDSTLPFVRQTQDALLGLWHDLGGDKGEL